VDDALLSTEQWEQLGRDLGADPAAPWAPFDAGSREAALCRRTSERLAVPTPRSDPSPASLPASLPAAAPDSTLDTPTVPSTVTGPPQIPVDLGRPHRGVTSTQQAFGRIIVDLHRAAPEVGRRLVTLSPDVASSTNLGGWINKVGVWTMDDQVDWFADDGDTALRWRESGAGQHIELGIAEGNLVGLLSELGVTWSRDGQPLLPIGSMYDPFVNRALEPWSFGIYAGGQSILVGTPSGITLAPEGGAHQSIISPSVGLEQPECIAWEPAFGQDLEWCLLHALSLLGRPGGTSSYFRLSSRPIDQALAPTTTTPAETESLRRDAVAGGYLLRRAQSPRIVLVGTGALMTEVARAADELARAGVEADVVCVTSADLLFRAAQARRGLQDGPCEILDRLFRAGASAPVVTVLDGHPHTLSFLGAVAGAPISCLGVSGFGQVGDIDDLYRHYRIDAAAIVGAAWDLLDEQDL
jgi:pyruvate dehydrogenase E1 component